MAVAPGPVECKDAHLHAVGVDTLPTRVLPPLALWTGSVRGGFEANLRDVTTDEMNGGNVHLAKSKRKHFKSCPFDFQIASRLLVKHEEPHPCVCTAASIVRDLGPVATSPTATAPEYGFHLALGC